MKLSQNLKWHNKDDTFKIYNPDLIFSSGFLSPEIFASFYNHFYAVPGSGNKMDNAAGIISTLSSFILPQYSPST